MLFEFFKQYFIILNDANNINEEATDMTDAGTQKQQQQLH